MTLTTSKCCVAHVFRVVNPDTVISRNGYSDIPRALVADGLYVARSARSALKGFVAQHNLSCDTGFAVKAFLLAYPQTTVTRLSDTAIVSLQGDYMDEIFTKTCVAWARQHVATSSFQDRGYYQLESSHIVH